MSVDLHRLRGVAVCIPIGRFYWSFINRTRNRRYAIGARLRSGVIVVPIATRRTAIGHFFHAVFVVGQLTVMGRMLNIVVMESIVIIIFVVVIVTVVAVLRHLNSRLGTIVVDTALAGWGAHVGKIVDAYHR